uniref:F-box protein 40, tandem duplicate 1 n=1 Tax=Echeneis naucrates TaxID=173247 RepID=A0A665TL77_ECHNA
SGRIKCSHRSRQHVHCDSCYSRRCRTRVEVSVSCAVIPCRLHCGALFHLCKEEDHLLLCPNVRVPCLNAEYGCPVHLARSSRAAHLQVCPASVVSCSMEWNRWPANDAHSYPNTELHERLLTEREKGGSLDLAMALKDQERLFHSIKMKKLFPELIQKDEDEDEAEAEHELSQEEREAIARASGVDTNLLDIYRAWENMFSMEMGGCREAGGAAVAGRGQDLAKRTQKNLGTLTEEDTADACLGAAASSGACVAPSTSSNKLMKKFIYGSMEPMKITTVRTFKIPTSFSAKQSRIRNPSFYKRESRAVDTSDLGVVPEDMPVWEEVQASLLCSLEKEQRGHLIAEGVCTDGLLQDEGSQTYNFPSAPFRRNTSLADLTVGKPLELHLQLQVESVTSRHHKASSAFTFLCGHTFQRREYGIHYRNVHSDIQMGVNGWFEQRCPLAYLGCTYRQRRFQPSTHEASVSYKRGQVGGGDGSLSSLPYEVLCHMASFLDSLSLSQLALVSRLMRQVVSSLLQDRGMVTLRWERKTYSHGGAKWRVKQRVWQFSTLFSPVDAWCFQDVPSMSEHLKVCPYYERESRTERIQLPRIREEVQTNTSCKAPTLVSLFQKKRIMM